MHSGTSSFPVKALSKSLLWYVMVLLFGLTTLGKDLSPKFDGSLYLTQLVRGNEAISPRPGSLCEIHALGYCVGKVFDDRDVSYVIGDFEEVGLPEGLDRALCYMSEGEEARIRICEPMTFSSSECTKRGIQKDSILYYLVKIKSCEQRKSVTVFSTFPEKMEHMQTLKQKANELLKVWYLIFLEFNV